MPVYGAGARVRGTLERGGPRPRAGRTLERGGARSREVLPLERGDARPKGVLPLERGDARPKGARILERGGACSRGSLRGPPRWAVRVPVGCVLHGQAPAWLGLTYLGFVVGFK
jgi:hypothetical protein